MQRLIAAYEAGRTVDPSNILKHELVSVPLSLSEMDGSLRTGNKAELMNLMTKISGRGKSFGLIGRLRS